MSSTSAPIDAVVTWVNGQDPVHRDKRLKFAATPRNSSQGSVHDRALRFDQSDELRYCIRSIRNFAPWIRKIHIVTDGQQPDFINLSHPKAADISIVDHKDIFAGYEDLLPTFNSLSIETMLWRIPGLAEKFIYFNDDFFLTGPASPDEYFDGDKLVVRGSVSDHSVPSPNKIQHQLHRHAALMLGQDATKVIRTRHCPTAMRVTFFERLSARLGARYFENARPRFRSGAQFSVSGLINQFALEEGLCHLVSPSVGVAIQMRNVPETKQEANAYLIEKFCRTDLKHMCVNQLASLKERCENTELLISARCGPPMAFECG